MGHKFQISLAAQVESLPVFRSFIDDACKQAHIEEEICFDIKLAVDEACTNIVQHGYKGVEPGSIILSLQYGVRQVAVRLSDFGRPFEPSEPLPPDTKAAFEEGELDGYGLFFIYQSMDVVSYDSTAGCNTLTMIKWLKDAWIQEEGGK